MQALLEAARQLAGAERAGVAFMLDGDVVSTLGWEASAIATRALWQRLNRPHPTAITTDGRFTAVFQSARGTEPSAALVFEGEAPLARSHMEALLSVLAALQAVRDVPTAPAGGPPTPGDNLRGYERWLLAADKKAALIAALEKHDWNISALADDWQVSRPAIYRAVARFAVPLDRTPVAARRERRYAPRRRS